MAKQPDIGDWIEHTCALNGRREGEVLEKLSAQFTYKSTSGHEKFCLYTEAWRKLPRPQESVSEDEDTHKPAHNKKQRKKRKT